MAAGHLVQRGYAVALGDPATSAPSGDVPSALEPQRVGQRERRARGARAHVDVDVVEAGGADADHDRPAGVGTSSSADVGVAVVVEANGPHPVGNSS